MKELFGEDRKFGIIGTLLVHGIVLIILLLFGFSAPPLEFPEPDGIVVDFGELVVGDDAGAPVEPVAVNPSTPSQPQSSEDSYVTQADVPSIPIKKNNTKVETPKQPELTPEEQERIRQENEFKQKMDALTGKLSGGGGTDGAGTAGNSTTGASTGKAGNPNGTESKNKKGNPGSPYGNGDAVNLVKPSNTSNCNNPIVLTVVVNSAGVVTSIQSVETALTEQACINAAKEAAKKTTFQPDERAMRYAKITYEYTTSKK